MAVIAPMTREANAASASMLQCSCVLEAHAAPFEGNGLDTDSALDSTLSRNDEKMPSDGEKCEREKEWESRARRAPAQEPSVRSKAVTLQRLGFSKTPDALLTQLVLFLETLIAKIFSLKPRCARHLY